jgi:transketolase
MDMQRPAASAVTHADMANAIRALSMDAVQKANSGHPGMPMGMADVATVLFTKFLKFDAAQPDWADRDRFVLSAGHGSMLLYSLLHLTGYKDMTLEDIRNFRQIGAKTAGHPEYGHAKGIETTTGPLGQGLANAVGMALAERILNARFGDAAVDHRTYVIAGDGCLMEGISHEAISLAGHLKLNRLVVLWDDNQISIDGPTSLSVSDDQLVRFKASGWAVKAIDGHDPAAIARALRAAQKSDKPSLIACRTVIGYGAPTKAGSKDSHGSPLGDTEIAGARQKLGWAHAPFELPEGVVKAWRRAGKRGAKLQKDWTARNAGNADLAATLSGDLAAAFEPALAAYKQKLATEKPKWATRKSSQMALEVINPVVPNTIGGSADLTGSNNTKTATTNPIAPGKYDGRYVYYGVREHGMAAAMNGMALHGGVIPYGGTFLVFTDYCRPSIRLSALMHQRVVYVMTHDSIGLGEDGPTHQPVEHLAALRAIPNLLVLRPADAIETAECWQIALNEKNRPSVLVLTRQDLPALPLPYSEANRCERGGYEVAAAEGDAKVTLLATGSEVAIALDARALLQKDGVATRVVSMPSFELFDAQPEDYRRATMGPGTVRVAVEAAVQQGWDKYTGKKGAFVGMKSFGASGPYQALYKHFGITPEAVAKAAKDRLVSL